MIQEMDQARALGLDVGAEDREAVKSRTGAKVAPGALLHIVSIGISDYGEHATKLKLAYAQKDARDVATALDKSTQSSLYADVKLEYLPNDQANRTAILDALETMRQTLAASPENRDLAVVMFSGHGAIIDGGYFLLPHDTDARTPARIKSSALSVRRFACRAQESGDTGAGACAAGRLPCGGGEWRWQGPGCGRQGPARSARRR